MPKSISIVPEDVRKPGQVTFDPIPVNQYQKSLAEERGRYSDSDLRRIHRDEVMTADELLLSSATKEVLPITLLDGQPVGDGQPGPAYHALYAGYQAAKKEEPPSQAHAATPATALSA